MTLTPTSARSFLVSGRLMPITLDGSPSMPVDEPAAEAVEGERAGHRERLAGGEVGLQFGRARRGEPDSGALHAAGLPVHAALDQPDHRVPGDQFAGRARHRRPAGPGHVLGVRFADHLAAVRLHHQHRVAADHHRVRDTRPRSRAPPRPPSPWPARQPVRLAPGRSATRRARPRPLRTRARPVRRRPRAARPAWPATGKQVPNAPRKPNQAGRGRSGRFGDQFGRPGAPVCCCLSVTSAGRRTRRAPGSSAAGSV